MKYATLQLDGARLTVEMLCKFISQQLPEESAGHLRTCVACTVQPGSSLAHVWHKLARWMLTDPTHGVVRLLDYQQEKEWILRIDERLQPGTELCSGVSSPLRREIPFRWAGQARALRVASAVCTITQQVTRVTFNFTEAVQNVVADWVAANSGWVRGYWVEERVAVDALAKKFLEVLSERN